MEKQKEEILDLLRKDNIVNMIKIYHNAVEGYFYGIISDQAFKDICTVVGMSPEDGLQALGDLKQIKSLIHVDEKMSNLMQAIGRSKHAG